jgi:hypothetical protein
MITEKWLAENQACAPGIAFWQLKKEPDIESLKKRALASGEYAIAFWLIARQTPPEKHFELIRRYNAACSGELNNDEAKKFLIAEGIIR